MRRILLGLALSLMISPAFADNYAATAGSGLTFGAKSIGGVLYPWEVISNSSGTELFTSGNSAYVQFPSAQTVTGTIANTTLLGGAVPSATNGLYVLPTTAATWAATQSGTWTVQPGNTANTTAWLVTGTESVTNIQGGAALSATNGLFVLPTTTAVWNATGTVSNTNLQGGAALSSSNGLFVSPTNAAVWTVVCSSGCSGSGGTASSFGSGFPATGTAIGLTNGTNMVAWSATTNYGTAPAAIAVPAVNAAVTNSVTVTPATSSVWPVAVVSGTFSGTFNTSAQASSSLPSLSAGTQTIYESLSGGLYTTAVQGSAVLSATNGLFVTPTSASIWPVSISSGADVTEGTTADAAYTSGSGTVIAILKGLYNGVTSSIPAGTNQIGSVTVTNALTVLGSVTPTQGSLPLSATNGMFVSPTTASIWSVNCVTGCSASTSITGWAGGTLGAMANYGTSPGAVLVPGVNSFVTNTVTATGTLAATSLQGGAALSATNGSYVNNLQGNVVLSSGNGLFVTPTTPSLWQTQNTSQYPVGSTALMGSVTGTTAVTLLTLTPGAGRTMYLCGFSIRANATAAVTGNATVTGTTSQLNFTQWTAPLASGVGITEMIFTPCVPGSAVNQAIGIAAPAPGSGGVVSTSGWGYYL